jgi:hypothetical protein
VSFEPWHMPILVTAAILVVASAYWAVTWYLRTRGAAAPQPDAEAGRPGDATADSDSVERRTARERRRLLIFATLTVLLVATCVISFGQGAADVVVAAVTAVQAVATAVVSVYSVFMLQRLHGERRSQEDSSTGGTGGGGPTTG